MQFHLKMNSNMYAKGIIEIICEEYLVHFLEYIQTTIMFSHISPQFSVDDADLYI